VAGLEFSALVANSLFIAVGGRFEYDLTDAGTDDSSGSVFPSQTPSNPRVPSHHIRYGFTVSAGYVF
jgi:hypothetical protein